MRIKIILDNIQNLIVMKYIVEFRKGWDMKAIHVENYDEALRMVRVVSYCLDLKIVSNPSKKDWIRWTPQHCTFTLDFTSKRERDPFHYIKVKSQMIPSELYGKSIVSIEKFLKDSDKKH